PMLRHLSPASIDVSSPAVRVFCAETVWKAANSKIDMTNTRACFIAFSSEKLDGYYASSSDMMDLARCGLGTPLSRNCAGKSFVFVAHFLTVMGPDRVRCGTAGTTPKRKRLTRRPVS